MSSWGRVFRSLRDPIPDENYHLGKSLVRVEQDADSVTAIFSDGTRERGDLLIGADGGRSTVRELFLPGRQPQYAGYVAWRAMLDERDVPPDIHAQLFANYTYCLPPGELFLAYPVPGRNNETQPGQRAYNIVWYRPTTPEKARRFLHRRERQVPRHLDPAAAVAARRHRLEQGAGPGAGGAAGRGDFRARSAAVLPGDLRFHLAADRVRPRRAARRCGVPGAAASGRRHHQMRDGRRAPRRFHRRARHRGGLAKYQREQGAFGAGLVRQGQIDGSYISDQLKPREQRRNKDVSWAVDDLMRDHDGRSAQVQRIHWTKAGVVNARFRGRERAR